MTQEEKIQKAQQSVATANNSRDRFYSKDKDIEDHLTVLELTISRLMWLIEQPTEQ